MHATHLGELTLTLTYPIIQFCIQVIRSHECVKLGVDFPYSRDVIEDFFAEPEVGRQSLLGGINMQPMPLRPEDPLLCTIFSASNYSDNGNEGMRSYHRV